MGERRRGLFDGCPGDLAGSSPDVQETRVAEWILAHAGPLLALTLRWLGPLATSKDAEDVLQELCVRLPKILTAYDLARGQLGPFLRKSLWNLCHDVRERLQRQHRVEGPSALREDDRGDTVLVEPRDPSPAADPAECVDVKEAWRALERILSELPAAQRRVWVLRELHGLSYEDIAAELGVPRGSVAGWLNRARARVIPRMREFLGEDIV